MTMWLLSKEGQKNSAIFKCADNFNILKKAVGMSTMQNQQMKC